jgi:hypothetical protein
MPSGTQSGIISLFSWSTPVTSLLPNPSFSQTPYLLHYLFSIEMSLENSTGFWKSLCTALNNPKTSLETAVKVSFCPSSVGKNYGTSVSSSVVFCVFQKASSSCKFATSSNYLTIYRWAQLVLDLPSNHELAFLIWQKFFIRYLHRVTE